MACQIDISENVVGLCRKNRKCQQILEGYLSKQIWNIEDRISLLKIVAKLFLSPKCTEDVCYFFSKVMLDVLQRNREEISAKSNINFVEHQKFCIALSKVAGTSEEIYRFAFDYLQNFPTFFACDEDIAPVAKKRRKAKEKSPTNRDLFHAVYKFAELLGRELSTIWDFSSILSFLNDEDTHVKWLALHSLAFVTGMSPSQLHEIRKQYFAEEEIVQLALSYSLSRNVVREIESVTKVGETSHPVAVPKDATHTMQTLLQSDLCSGIQSVCGILLPRLQLPDESKAPEELCSNTFEELVSVPSTYSNLKCLAQAVAKASPVLLEGPVGCGKTALVEHLAWITGRKKTPYIMKIQLGDETDSKALLGTYRCTDIPGEFEWCPGSLTCAIKEGYWVLLEDIDYAPMDVISTLVPILENRTLTVPGHGDIIKASTNFRIFATQRLLTSGSNIYRQHTASSEILDKLWTKINVQPLSRAELKQVILSKYSHLTTVVEKLIDIYFLLAANEHGDNSEGEYNEDVKKLVQHEGRLISTRDLLKWVSRISLYFEDLNVDTGNTVFQEAFDCFCACVANAKNRLRLAEIIGAKLNVTKAKVEYYCNAYKPTIEITRSEFCVGRTSLKLKAADLSSLQRSKHNFAFTRNSLTLLERVAVSVTNGEPVLLVGETGVGKTASIQYLAHQLGNTLKVINMNQQSGSADLLGGFKPLDLKFVVAPLMDDFELLFCNTFSRKQNAKYLSHIQQSFLKRRWADIFKLLEHSQKSGLDKYEEKDEMYTRWINMGKKLYEMKLQIKQTENTLAFSFIEGTLVKALRNGHWVLLDEINLASAETLECLSGLLESTSGSVVLLERGDTVPVIRHPEFKLFACMNPATDVGKKDLPPGLRNRFTEFFVDELDDEQELKILVAEYLKGLSLDQQYIDGIVKFYKLIKLKAQNSLMDGTGKKPHFSLRTLCRALYQAAMNTYGNVTRSIYEAFCLSFLTQLDRSSHPLVEKLICSNVIGKVNVKSLLKQAVPAPSERNHLQFEGYWLSKGAKEAVVPEGYVLTPSVRANLRDLARIVSAGRYAVLIQGETSVGKTSMITWLAKSTGNICMRINNHEHTDLQEYIGCYAAGLTGKLVFQEGVLVEAMRKGHWIILDELNLAPSDVLEALNRLLDDNRELFIPETQETIKAHPKFMLFATQNPPGLYGGRKVLSRAFRNRFIELHFDEIPYGELETILHQRCSLPLSYCKKLVAILLDLQKRRRGSGVFAGKQGFITLRDLFRWAERYRLASNKCQSKYFDWEQLLADNGYMLLAGRVRNEEECSVVQEIIQKHLKRKVIPENIFSLHDKTSATTKPLLELLLKAPLKGFEHIVWTYSMRRMAVLLYQALQFEEPVLLVGETGCGKTTVCQLYSMLKEQFMYSVNCHMHTESADFLGGLRPSRHRDKDDQRLFDWCDGPLVCSMKQGSMFLIDEISLADDSVLERLNSVLEPERTLLLAEKGGNDGGLNEVEQIVAEDSFRIVGTMNPGGDYGKKELSPALRNRFTEVWCPLDHSRDDLIAIIEHNIKPGVVLSSKGDDCTSGIGKSVMDFLQYLSNHELGKRVTITIRDILSWVRFINATAISKESGENHTSKSGGKHDIDLEQLQPAIAYIHGAFLVCLDMMGAGVTGSINSYPEFKSGCLKFLCSQMCEISGELISWKDAGVVDVISGDQDRSSAQMVKTTAETFGIGPFHIEIGKSGSSKVSSYALEAPTTCLNAQRVLRALQLSRPILLEGSPGVGKTSLVAAIAKASGHELIRINLSEQTDVSDLFGADLPVEGGEAGRFAWRDGPLLQALKDGHWIVLDELNLASQSVLEGLNACLDHRAEVYVPELSMTFEVQHEKTRIFACQNPMSQGGGRKGLPKSFLNRFTQVYVEPLSTADLQFICQEMYPQIPGKILSKMIEFNMRVHYETMVLGSWGQIGNPWEFNLRDIFRWADLLLANQAPECFNPGEYVTLIYTNRMRTEKDKEKMNETFLDVFGPEHNVSYFNGEFLITDKLVQIGHSFLERKEAQFNTEQYSGGKASKLLHHSLPHMESLMKCIELNWMTLLIGGAGCGKTALVHTLAELVGCPLVVLPMNSSFDTIELLGGFEQTDLKRHLEDLENSVEQIVNDAIKQLLLLKLDSLKDVADLMKTKFSYKKQHLNSGTTLKEEVDIQEQKMDMLMKLLQLLKQICTGLICNEQIETTMQSLQKLQRKLKEEKYSNQGGKFEWIDSVFVKALKDGHWLLIENVNFCSPCVLDRLNALLEPGGSLSINERGVVEGGIPTVKPHPDFRLILTMNPNHGEISRAMRNRGVEIFILGEHEGVKYSKNDIKQLLHSFGVLGKVPCETIIDVHEAINSLQSFRVKFGIVELLRVGSLVQQQLQRGLNFKESLYNSCTEVYVSAVLQKTDKKVILDKIEEMLESFDLAKWEDEFLESSLLDVSSWPNPLPSVSDWCKDVTLANVRKSSTMLFHVLNLILEKTTNRRGLPLSYKHLLSANNIAAEVTKSKIDAMMQFLIYIPSALMITVESLSTKTSPHLLQYFMENYKDIQLNLKEDCTLKGIEDEDKKLFMQYGSNLFEVFSSLITGLQGHPMFALMCAELKGISSSSVKGLQDVLGWNLDLRWSPNLLNRAKRNIGGDCSLIDWSYIFSIVNQIYLVAYLLQSKILHNDGLATHELSVKKMKQHQISPLQVSYAYNSGILVGEDQSFQSEVYAHLYTFVTLFDNELYKFLQEFRAVDDERFIWYLQGLAWYERFVQLCQKRQKWHNRTATMFLPTLSLHWNWVHKFTVVPIGGKCSYSKELLIVISKLNKILGMDEVTSRLHNVIWTNIAHPSPYPSEDVANGMMELARLCKDLDIFQKRVICDDRKVTLWMDQGSSLKKIISEAVLRINSEICEGEYVQECITGVKTAVEKLCLEYGVPGTPNLAEHAVKQFRKAEDLDANAKTSYTMISASTRKELEILPLRESEHISTQVFILGQLLNGLRRKTDINSIIDYKLAYASVQSCSLEPWMSLLEDNGEEKHLSELQLNVMQCLTGNSVMLNILQCNLLQPRSDGVPDIKVTPTLEAMCTGFLSGIIFTLFMGENQLSSNSSESVNDDFWLHGNITLGQMSEKISQLKLLSKNICQHLGIMKSSKWSIKKNMFLVSKATLQRLLMSCSALVPEMHDMVDIIELVFARNPTNLENNLIELMHLIQQLPLNPLLPEFKILLGSCLKTFRKCFAIYGSHGVDETSGFEDYHKFENMMALSMFITEIGLLQSLLLVPQGPVDPAEKIRIQLQYALQELDEINNELYVRTWNNQILSGVAIADVKTVDMHPRIMYLLDRRLELEKMIKIYSEQKATRPNPSQFEDILVECKQYIKMAGSVKKIKDLIERLNTALIDTMESKSLNKQVLSEVCNWNVTVDGMIRRLQDRFPLYKDILTPFIIGVTQIQLGLQLAACTVRMASDRLESLNMYNDKSVDAVTLSPNKPWLESVMTTLCRFPFTTENITNSLDWAKQLMSNECLVLVRHLVSCNDVRNDESDMLGEDSNSKILLDVKCTSRILQSCLHLVKGHATLVGNFNVDIISALSNIFSLYMSSWQQQEEEKRRKEAEEGSLFKYKEKIHGEELKEDEKDERERRKMFPTYDEEFMDIKVGYTLDDSKRLDNSSVEDSGDDLYFEIGKEEMHDVAMVHHMLFSSLTNTPWYSGKVTAGQLKQLKKEHIMSVVKCFEVAATIGKLHSNMIAESVNGELFGAHLVISTVLQSAVTQDELLEFKQDTNKPFDIYYDANVREAIQCRPLLENMKKRVLELLSEWEDHPTLKELVIVINRIIGFPVTNPLMKFVTGLEVLLQKTQEWESNAARHVSLRVHIDCVMQIIIQWRKLELQCWKTCLDDVVHRVQQKASKWWFYLFQLTADFLSDENEETPRKLETGKGEIDTQMDILKTYQKFMESSGLGEFGMRLNLLHSFLCQLVHMEISPKQNDLIKILWNVHTYYKQFLPNVEQQIIKLRTPIEKELKNFVKIARWNDLNFYALKQAVEKTHKTLHKSIKQFENVLHQPVSIVLTETSSDWQDQNSTGKTVKNGSALVGSSLTEVFVIDIETTSAIQQKVMKMVEMDENSILHRLPSLCTKVKKHVKGVIHGLYLGAHIQAVEDFTGELIESVHELQNLDVNPNADKDRQKKEAKHINMRKRKSLADLFKFLQTLGLSYRRGLIFLQDPTLKQKLLAPLDISAFNSKGKVQDAIQNCWNDCEKYQMRCVARSALLFSALANPSKELGVGNIDRCKGFTVHLSTLVTAQWDKLAHAWTEVLHLQQYIQTLHQVANCEEALNQGTAMEHVNSIKTLCDDVIEFLTQLVTVMQCFPKDQPALETVQSPIPMSQIAKLLTSCQKDEVWIQANCDMENSIELLLCEKGKLDILAVHCKHWVGDSDVRTLADIVATFGKVKVTLHTLKTQLLMPETEENNCLTKPLLVIEKRINVVEESFESWLAIDSEVMDDNHDSWIDLEKKTEKLITLVLLAIQESVKLKDSKANVHKVDEDGEEFLDLVDNHLTDHVIKDVNAFMGNMRIAEVANLSSEIIHLVTSSRKKKTVMLFSNDLLPNILPVLDQYFLLVQYFISQNIGCLKSSAKLLSVLLGVFSELAQKGFCLPAEFSDEVEGEGATEFKDIEGGGLGEGEGVKDVSDQIESEDQLDETKMPGQEEKDDKEPDVKPEDNAIEMSDDFDGKMQDLEAKQGSDDDDENNDEDKVEISKARAKEQVGQKRKRQDPTPEPEQKKQRKSTSSVPPPSEIDPLLKKSRSSRSKNKKKTPSSQSVSGEPVPTGLFVSAEPPPAMQEWVKSQMTSQFSDFMKLMEARLPAPALGKPAALGAPTADKQSDVDNVPMEDTPSVGSLKSHRSRKSVVRETSPVREISPVHDRSEGEQSPEKEDALRLRTYATEDEESVEDFGSVHIGIDSQYESDGVVQSSEAEFEGQRSEQDFTDVESLPDEKQDTDVNDNLPYTAKQEADSQKAMWNDVVNDICYRYDFKLLQSKAEVAFPGDSPTRPSVTAVFPPSEYQKSHFEHVSKIFAKDMRDKDKSKYRTVFPRPPKHSTKFALAGEELNENGKVPRPQINEDFEKLVSTEKHLAAKPVGFCVLNTSDTKLLENTASWQRRQLYYQDLMTGNARLLIKDVLQDCEETSKISPEQRANLMMASKSLEQSAQIAKKFITPAACYMEARLQAGRRDTYLNRLDTDIPQESVVKLRASRFALSADEPLFDPSVLRTLASELKDYRLMHPKSAKPYVKYSMKGNKTARDKLQNFSFSGGRRNRRQQQQRQKFNTPAAAPAVNNNPSSRGKRGKPRGGGANRGRGEEDEIDKKMGDVDGDSGETDKLDEKIWGSDDEDDKEEQEKDKTEEFGPGAGQESKPELVAKDENQDDTQADKNEKDPESQDNKDEDNPDDMETKEKEGVDEREYDENEADPYQNEDKSQDKQAQDLDLPEDMDIGEDENGQDEEGKDEEGENPCDIDTMLEDKQADKDDTGEEAQEEEDANNKEEEDEEDNENSQETSEDLKDKDGTSEEQAEKEEGMEIEEDEEKLDQEEEGLNKPRGLEPQDEGTDEPVEEEKKDDKDENATPQAAESISQTAHDTQEVQQLEDAKDSAGKKENEQKEKAGVGQSDTQQEEGHQSEEQTSVTTGAQPKQQQSQRKPGKSKEDRSLGSVDEQVKKRLKTMDSYTSDQQQEQQEDESRERESDIYEHIKDSQSRHDAQTMDVATLEQQQQQPEASNEDMGNDDGNENEEEDDTMPMKDREDKDQNTMEKLPISNLKKMKDKSSSDATKDNGMEIENDTQVEIEGEKIETCSVPRGGESSIHTAMEHLEVVHGELDIEKLRRELEEDLGSMTLKQPVYDEEEQIRAAGELWRKYEAVTARLSQELCEQLRLVLEPSQATKLKGDYRTGKRLNMRKVIPYIASQFRKDKIWLRRTKPSKRNYQVLLAVDDSSSMADNHLKQLAFESLATIANALTLLEVGQLSIWSFGDSVQEFHPFHETFSNLSGAKILQQFSFDQKKTRIAQLLKRVTDAMVKARAQQIGQVSNVETSQLLLIVSDGKGLFLEGMEVVKSAVRQAREANVFVVFVILDNPENKDSILDICVPEFKGPGQLPEIKSYMEHFPFPFYIILRDINSLPTTLGDALRQWFELVTVGDG